MSNVKVIGYVDPENIERMDRGNVCGFMIEDKPDARRNCAVMSVEDHEKRVQELEAALSIATENRRILAQAVLDWDSPAPLSSPMDELHKSCSHIVSLAEEMVK